MFPNQVLGIQVLVANFKTKVCVAVLYAKPGWSDDSITNAIDETVESKIRDYKIVLGGDINIDMGTERGREFRKIMDSSLAIVPWENTFKSPGKTRLRTADPPEDDDPRLECRPDPWNFAAQIDWEGDDDGYPM
ncbi:ATP-dependent DNA helicase [Caerostris extrusa]|uniref:ATP-dependent DNA helicase n=1 Tax=Caerostris extrusa TaxID=172846 RepID=A0AAV4WGE8_CAEEX|nr:ATP-dependent DNA helicase [Caerostris extrusa]